MRSQKNSQNPKNPKKSDNWIRYSGLGFEMIFIILLGVFGGIKLDNILNSKPLLTVLLSLAGVIMAIYFALKDLLRKPENEKK